MVFAIVLLLTSGGATLLGGSATALILHLRNKKQQLPAIDEELEENADSQTVIDLTDATVQVLEEAVSMEKSNAESESNESNYINAVSEKNNDITLQFINQSGSFIGEAEYFAKLTSEANEHLKKASVELEDLNQKLSEAGSQIEDMKKLLLEKEHKMEEVINQLENTAHELSALKDTCNKMIQQHALDISSINQRHLLHKEEIIIKDRTIELLEQKVDELVEKNSALAALVEAYHAQLEQQTQTPTEEYEQIIRELLSENAALRKSLKETGNDDDSALNEAHQTGTPASQSIRFF